MDPTILNLFLWSSISISIPLILYEAYSYKYSHPSTITIPNMHECTCTCVYAHTSFIMDRMVMLQLFDLVSCSKVTGWMILVQTSVRDFLTMLFLEKRKRNRVHCDNNGCTIKCAPFASNNAFLSCFFSCSFLLRMLLEFILYSYW